MKLSAKQAARIDKIQRREDMTRKWGRPTGPTKAQFVSAVTRLTERERH